MKSRKVSNSSGALNGSFVSGGQSIPGHTDNIVHKDLDFGVSDGLRYRKGNVEKNSGNSVGNTTNSVCDTTANLYQDISGSDPEQNDYSFSIDSVNPKKMRSSETNETPQLLGSDGFSVSPSEVGSSYFLPNLLLLGFQICSSCIVRLLTD